MKELTLTKKAWLKGNSAAIDPRDQLPSRSEPPVESAKLCRAIGASHLGCALSFGRNV